MKFLSWKVALLTLAGVVLTACGTAGGSKTGAQATPDVCAAPYIKVAAGQINEYTQQFDDESALATNVPVAQLPPYIEVLQGIRRAAENQAVPPCLMQLKQLQLSHMNTVVNTMLSFLGGGNAQGVAQAMGTARHQHDQYVLELARILDVTPTIITPPPTPNVTATPETPTPADTPTASAATTAQPAGVAAINPGPYPINLRQQPSPYGKLVTTLDVGKSVVAIAATGDGQWLQVVVPDHAGQLAWVLASDVQLVTVTP